MTASGMAAPWWCAGGRRDDGAMHNVRRRTADSRARTGRSPSSAALGLGTARMLPVGGSGRRERGEWGGGQALSVSSRMDDTAIGVEWSWKFLIGGERDTEIQAIRCLS